MHLNVPHQTVACVCFDSTCACVILCVLCVCVCVCVSLHVCMSVFGFMTCSAMLFGGSADFKGAQYVYISQHHLMPIQVGHMVGNFNF